MLLCIDIGNTNLTLGIYQESTLVSKWRLATDHDRMPDEYGLQILGLINHGRCSKEDLKGVCMASVVPILTERIRQACAQYLDLDPFILDEKAITNVNILYERPASVGADRIADAIAVKHLYSGPACVVDFGTATTFDAITADGDYLGGAITPGIGISSEALFSRTAKLPRVELKRPPSVIGRNTIHAIQSGLLFGYVSMVEGMISRFRDELGASMKVIATGGLAEVVSSETNAIDIIAPWLTLDGLSILWNLNR